MAGSNKLPLRQRIRNALLGKPIASAQAHNEKLSPLLGLPVLSSDALSSVAYGTEAILGILVLSGLAALHDVIWIAVAIAALVAIIATSYNQTIHAYPNGGGSYIVASENLGEVPGLIAGAALLIDYVLTVSVSIAAGVLALVSAYPTLSAHLVMLCLLATFVIAYMNLRGLKESGTVFALPVYAFIGSILVMIALGFFRVLGHPVPPVQHAISNDLGKELHASVLYLILRAFAAGCTALTGVEAVSNGVPAFRAPESKNASTTLKLMATLLIVMFLGISILSRFLPTINLLDGSDPRYQSVVSQIASLAFGGKNFGFYFVQWTTAIILLLAANTSFADFPRLASLLARDGYLPRSLSRQGDRLVFHNGIILLGVFAGGLIWGFGGKLDALLPLYAVGVFAAFTMSQAGMVIHWFRLKEEERHWRSNAVVNGIGSFLSGVVLIIIFTTKFTEGAWMVGLLMAILFAIFKAIKARYASISKQLAMEGDLPRTPSNHTVLLLVPRVHKGIVSAIQYARLIQGDVKAIHVTLDDRNLTKLSNDWKRLAGTDIPLMILPSPFRSLITPLLDYIDKLKEKNPDVMITVIVPEAISIKPFHKLLQENVGLQLKLALSTRPNVVVTNTRYFLD